MKRLFQAKRENKIQRKGENLERKNIKDDVSVLGRKLLLEIDWMG